MKRKRLVKKTLLLACQLSLCSLALFSQTRSRPRAVRNTETSAILVSPQEAPVGLKKIYSNLGSVKTDLFNASEGSEISGPNSGSGEHSFALPFTPKSNSHVSQVQVSVQHAGGANQVNVSIYGDADGVPGTLLTGPITVTGLATTGTCCALAVANFSPVAVTGGSRYWVVADTPSKGTGSDFVGEWEWVAKPIYPGAFSDGFGWIASTGSPTEVAGEVLGTIP
jgi:hypothetical protein